MCIELVQDPVGFVAKLFVATNERAGINKVLGRRLTLRGIGVELPFFISFWDNSEGDLFHMAAKVPSTLAYIRSWEFFLAETTARCIQLTCMRHLFVQGSSFMLLELMVYKIDPRAVLCLRLGTHSMSTDVRSKVIHDMVSMQDFQHYFLLGLISVLTAIHVAV